MERDQIEALRRQGYLDDETANLMLNDLAQQMEGIPVDQRRSVAVAISRGPGRTAKASSHGEGVVTDVNLAPPTP